MEIRRGDVVDIDFGTPWGSEQGGIRPAIVVQNDIGNRYSPAIQVTPITSQYKKKTTNPRGFVSQYGKRT